MNEKSRNDVQLENSELPSSPPSSSPPNEMLSPMSPTSHFSENPNDEFELSSPLSPSSFQPVSSSLSSHSVKTQNDNPSLDDIVTRMQRERRRLLTIFYRRNVSLNGQKELMKFMRTAPPITLAKLPIPFE